MRVLVSDHSAEEGCGWLGCAGWEAAENCRCGLNIVVEVQKSVSGGCRLPESHGLRRVRRSFGHLALGLAPSHLGAMLSVWVRHCTA